MSDLFDRIAMQVLDSGAIVRARRRTRFELQSSVDRDLPLHGEPPEHPWGFDMSMSEAPPASAFVAAESFGGNARSAAAASDATIHPPVAAIPWTGPLSATAGPTPPYPSSTRLPDAPVPADLSINPPLSAGRPAAHSPQSETRRTAPDCPTSLEPRQHDISDPRQATGTRQDIAGAHAAPLRPAISDMVPLNATPPPLPLLARDHPAPPAAGAAIASPAVVRRDAHQAEAERIVSPAPPVNTLGAPSATSFDDLLGISARAKLEREPVIAASKPVPAMPMIEVTIGRLEIRGDPAAVIAPRSTKAFKPREDLASYRARRDRAQ